MPRRARFTFENAIYHILSRGNNRQSVFLHNDDCKKFLELLSFYKGKYSLKIYHYVLMTNHYHMVLQAKDGSTLASAMKGLNLSYAKYYRDKYGGIGYFWQGRFKSFIIQDGRYILECGRYIELNPVRAGMVDSIEKYRWTSYRVYGEGKKSSSIDINPEYLGLAASPEKRQVIYRQFVVERFKQGQLLEKYFHEGAYGCENFVEMLRKKGLIQIKPCGGRPKKVEAKT
jgi:putative transposase